MLRSLPGKNKKTSLNHEQIFTITVLAQKSGNNFFATLPDEILEYICTVENPNPRLQKALHHAAFGELDELKAMLDEAQREGDDILKLLLLPVESTETPGGLTVKNTTLLECALLAGDPEMVAMIKPYFSAVAEGKKDMEKEMQRQLDRCKPCVDSIMTQSEDLTWLFDIIKAASASDVAKELKTGNEYDETYQSPLRHALNKWRQYKLDPNNRVIDVLRKPRMHCHYANWIHVNAFLGAEWDRNRWRDLKVTEDNYDKIYLILRQLRGFIELLELPACDRFAFANGQVAGLPTRQTRSLKYKYNDGLFPLFDLVSIGAHSGLGFDFFVSTDGAQCSVGRARRWMNTVWSFFPNLISSKNVRLAALMQPHPAPQQRSERIFT